MQVHRARTHAAGAQAAVEELLAGANGFEPEVVFAFCSTRQDLGEIARRLAGRWPNAITVGCSTTGEQLDGVSSTGSVVLSALRDTGTRWGARLVPDLTAFDDARAGMLARALAADIGADHEGLDPHRHFAVALFDGLAMREEAASALLAESLEGIPLLGGSAGDDLRFKETRVFCNGVAATNAAVVILAETARPFTVLKHQHFTSTSRSVVVTHVDPSTRRVYELDGLPAAEAYARALGVTMSELHDELTFMNPLVFSCNGELYVRSIQRIEPDGSIVFYCGVEEGVVLTVGGHRPMASSLATDLAELQRRPASFMLTFNCILRALEAKKTSCAADLSDNLRSASATSIGFDTYGEQLAGLHINQTLVAVAIHG